MNITNCSHIGNTYAYCLNGKASETVPAPLRAKDSHRESDAEILKKSGDTSAKVGVAVASAGLLTGDKVTLDSMADWGVVHLAATYTKNKVNQATNNTAERAVSHAGITAIRNAVLSGGNPVSVANGLIEGTSYSLMDSTLDKESAWAGYASAAGTYAIELAQAGVKCAYDKTTPCNKAVKQALIVASVLVII